MIVSLKNCNPFELFNPGGRKVVSKRFLFELNYDFSVLRLWSPSRKAGYKQYKLKIQGIQEKILFQQNTHIIKVNKSYKSLVVDCM